MSSIIDVLRRAMQVKPVARGRFNNVYEIPSMQDLVLRFPRSIESPIGQDSAKIDILDYELGKLNVGQPIAQIGTEQILLKKPGNTFGQICSGKIDYSTPTTDEDEWQAYVETVEKIAGLPQSSYDQLTKEVRELLQRGHAIDGQGDNLVIFKNSLGTLDVDFNNPASADRRSRPEGILKLLVGNVADLGVPYVSYDQDKIPDEDTERNRLFNAYGVIIKKWADATENEGLPLYSPRIAQIKMLLTGLLGGDGSAADTIVDRLEKIPQEAATISQKSGSPKMIATLDLDADVNEFNEVTRDLRRAIQQSQVKI